MADTKISALTSSTTPLAGTEVLPIVQSSTTKQVSVANLTAGRAVGMLSNTINGNTAVPSVGSITGTNQWQIGADSVTNVSLFDSFVTANQLVFRRANGTLAAPTALALDNGITLLNFRGYGTTAYSTNRAALGAYASEAWTDSAQGTHIRFSTTTIGGTSTTEKLRILDSGDISVLTGNVVMATNGKGIDFSATPGTGTSELFADYEEGTWTPTYVPATNSFTSITYGFQSGKYTKVGNLVTVTFRISTSALTVGTASGTLYLGGLPYTPNGSGNSCVGGVRTQGGGGATWGVNFPQILVSNDGAAQFSMGYSTSSITATATINVTDLAAGSGNVMAGTVTYNV